MSLKQLRVTQKLSIAGALLVAFGLAPTANAQDIPGPDQAPMIVQGLDANGNGKIDEDEAIDQIADNFSMIDTDGDGGISVEELTTILKMLSGDTGSDEPTSNDVFDRVDHHMTKNGDVDLHYVTLGEGPVVLFVHGFPDFWYSWREQMDALSGDFKTVAMDTRAYNKSGKPDGVENYAMSFLLGDVEAVIKDLGVDTVTLVGHDWGGGISWQFAMRYPQYVNKLVILNLTHPKGYGAVRANATADQKANTQYITDFQTPGFEDQLTPQVLTSISAGNVSPEVRQHYLDAFTQSSAKGMLDYYRSAFGSATAGGADPFGGEMPNLAMPVLQFHGLKDTAVDKDGLRDTWNWINEDYTLVTIPSSNHWVQREAADMVSTTMLWWLKSRP